MKLFALIYSLICYLIGFATLTYLILFIGDYFVSWTINAAAPTAPRINGIAALIWNAALIALWGLQHSVMADPAFKARWTRLVPPAIERSTYLLAVAITTAGLIALWVPMPAVLWDSSGSVLGTILTIGFCAGWAIVLISTFLINHFQLFGLAQAFALIKETPPKQESFVTPFFYKLVRHPMMTGVLIALWCAPVMTVGRLLFNLAMTAYLLLGTEHEEQTLIEDLGDTYREYQKSTPKLIPRMPGSVSERSG